MISILFVCQGNICRSPAFHALLEKKLKDKGITDWYVDSCGTSGAFIGSEVDRRMQRELEKKGVSFSHKARSFEPTDYFQFDYIFVISEELKSYLVSEAPKEAKKKIFLASHFAKKGKDCPIPDPYYTTEGGFKNVLDFIDECVEGIYEKIFRKNAIN